MMDRVALAATGSSKPRHVKSSLSVFASDSNEFEFPNSNLLSSSHHKHHYLPHVRSCVRLPPNVLFSLSTPRHETPTSSPISLPIPQTHRSRRRHPPTHKNPPRGVLPQSRPTASHNGISHSTLTPSADKLHTHDWCPLSARSFAPTREDVPANALKLCSQGLADAGCGCDRDFGCEWLRGRDRCAHVCAGLTEKVTKETRAR